MDESLPRRLLRATGLGRPSTLMEAAESLQRLLRDGLPALAELPRVGRSALQPRLDRLTRGHPASSSAPALPQGAAFLSGSFDDPAGSRPYRLYVPARRVDHPPLVVMLHGCTQDAEDFATGTRMNQHAEAHGAMVLYPVQTAGANAQRCWNWFNPADQAAGQGEPAIIAGMTRWVAGTYDVDPARIFAAGLSAGGAQAAILGSAYPDLFAAIGVHSGLACGAASDVMSAFAAMRQGRAGQGRITIPTIVFHGDRDGTVNIRNADEVAAQVIAPGNPRLEQGQVPGGLAYTKAVHTPARLEQWTVHGAGHAWSGGSPDGTYTEPQGPDASAEMLRFFLNR